MSEYKTQATAVKAQFDSGMQRGSDSGKPRFDLIFPLGVPYDQQLFTRWGMLMTRGVPLYGERNWEKAGSEEELERFQASAFRHFMQWLAGETDEDHAAAVLFNIQGAEFVRWRLLTDSGDAFLSAARAHQEKVQNGSC